MPTYSWKQKSTGRIVDVIRSFSEYTVPPTSEELGGAETSDEDWERIIVGKPTVNKPWNWGRKGEW